MIVYDKKCMLCSVSMAFVIRHDRRRIFRLVPAQSELGRAAYRDHGLDPDALATMIVIADGRARTESDAALHVLAALGWPWRVAAAGRAVPRFVRDPVYRWIARNRYRWFGMRHACALPDTAARRRPVTGLLVHPAVVAALAYLAATLLFQFRPFSTRALGLDLLGILPRWKFFIPQPGRFEVAVELRGGSGEGDLDDWVPVRLFPPRGALTWLWFPEQHRSTILWLSAHRVATQARRGDHATAQDTLAYQTLVRHMRQTVEARDHAIIQFALVHPNDRPDDLPDRTIFLSQMHAL